jgi:hypothetical protein
VHEVQHVVEEAQQMAHEVQVVEKAQQVAEEGVQRTTSNNKRISSL